MLPAIRKLAVPLVGLAIAATFTPAVVNAAPQPPSAGAVTWGWDDEQFQVLDVPAAAKANVAKLAAGGAHILALTHSGEVVAWGNDEYGQATVPTEARTGVTDVAAIGVTSYAVKDGRIVMWGQPFEPPPDRNDIVSISVSSRGGLATTHDGSVVGWSHYGGAASKKAYETVPAEVRDVDTIAAGQEVSVALRNGKPLVWVYDTMLPVPEGLSSGVTFLDVTTVTARSNRVYAIKDGVLHTWRYGWEWPDGQKPYRVIADYETVPYAKPLIKVSRSGWHILGLTTAGEVVSVRGSEYERHEVDNIPPAAWSGVTDVIAMGPSAVALRLIDVPEIKPRLTLACRNGQQKTVVCQGTSRDIPVGGEVDMMLDRGAGQKPQFISTLPPSVTRIKTDGTFTARFTNPFAKRTPPDGYGYQAVFQYPGGSDRWYYSMRSNIVPVRALGR